MIGRTVHIHRSDTDLMDLEINGRRAIRQIGRSGLASKSRSGWHFARLRNTHGCRSPGGWSFHLQPPRTSARSNSGFAAEVERAALRHWCASRLDATRAFRMANTGMGVFEPELEAARHPDRRRDARLRVRAALIELLPSGAGSEPGCARHPRHEHPNASKATRREGLRSSRSSPVFANSSRTTI